MTAVRSLGQNGNRYVQQRDFAQEFGPEGFDFGKYIGGQVNAYARNNGQEYAGQGWNGYQETVANVFNPYQKQGYVGGYQNQQGFNGGQGFGDGGQFFGGSGPAQPVNFVGNHRIRIP